MSTMNRATVFAKAHKVLKKYYKPIAPPHRSVLEHLLYACLLENAHYGPADRAFEALQTGFFDWNEVRVSTVRELAESMPMLPQPEVAANNLRKALYAVFESTYSFDLEGLLKQNLGQAQQKLQKLDGVTPFVLGYVTQTILGGHCIPLDRGALECLRILVGLSDKELREANVSGLERAIPKNKGVEFGSLLHQLGADLVDNSFSQGLHKILLEIVPDAKDRLPKKAPKGVAKPEPPKSAVPAKVEKPADKAKSEKSDKTDKVEKKPLAKKGSEAPLAKSDAPRKDKDPAKKSAGLAKRKPK